MTPKTLRRELDQATWYRRRDALKRDVAQSGDALTTFRADHPDLVVGYKSGGGVNARLVLTVVTIP